MRIKKQKSKINTYYNKLPTKVFRNEFKFNQFIKLYLSRGRRDPKLKISSYKTFNYILYVLHTGIQ